MSESLVPLTTDGAPPFVGRVPGAALDAQGASVLQMTERLFGAVASVAQRSDPELPDERYFVFRVHAADGDGAFEKQLEWNRWMIDHGGAESHRFRLSVVVRQ